MVGERRVTIVFDRGGWSPQLFQQFIADGFDILTYRKGRRGDACAGSLASVAPRALRLIVPREHVDPAAVDRSAGYPAV